MAIRNGKWKLLAHQASVGNNYATSQLLQDYQLSDDAPDAPGQLYNLEDDPGETHNLYLKHPEVVRELQTMLEQSITSGRSTPVRDTENN